MIFCMYVLSSEELKKNRLMEITELLRLEHLDTQKRKSVINLISNSKIDSIFLEKN